MKIVCLWDYEVDGWSGIRWAQHGHDVFCRYLSLNYVDAWENSMLGLSLFPPEPRWDCCSVSLLGRFLDFGRGCSLWPLV
jgi:hypothetical protein